MLQEYLLTLNELACIFLSLSYQPSAFYNAKLTIYIASLLISSSFVCSKHPPRTRVNQVVIILLVKVLHEYLMRLSIPGIHGTAENINLPFDQILYDPNGYLFLVLYGMPYLYNSNKTQNFLLFRYYIKVESTCPTANMTNTINRDPLQTVINSSANPFKIAR